MPPLTELTLTDHLIELLDHLGIAQAHFAARGLGDLTGLAARQPERFASLTLLSPAPPKADIVRPLADRFLAFRSDGPAWDQLEAVVKALPGAQLAHFRDDQRWSDLVAQNKHDFAVAMLPFLAANTAALAPTHLSDGAQGAVAGITYHIQGAGPPLILMPLGLAASQWDPLLPELANRFCTITLGGARLGFVALLEMRAQVEGYQNMVRYLLDAAGPQPGESMLEVGCGTGAIVRRLAHDTAGANPITAVDINRYFLREAANLARLEDVDDRINFEEGNAEALPYPDGSFDLTMSVTVMEEVDADKMLAEMARVTRPGGRVAVIVRAMDVPAFVNLRLSPALRAKVEDPGSTTGAAGAKGCADASLYRRFQAAGLIQINRFLHQAVFDSAPARQYFNGAIQPALTPAEAAEWQAAWAVAEAEGTFFFAYPHHCAVGTKLA